MRHDLSGAVLGLVMLVGGFATLIAVEWAFVAAWEALTGRRVTIEGLHALDWPKLALAGVLSGVILYAMRSAFRQSLITGLPAAEVLLGMPVGIVLFGLLGGLLLRWAGLAGFGQLTGIAFGAAGGGALLVDMVDIVIRAAAH